MKRAVAAAASSSALHATVFAAGVSVLLNHFVWPGQAMTLDEVVAVQALLALFYRAILEPLGSLLAARLKHLPRQSP